MTQVTYVFSLGELSADEKFDCIVSNFTIQAAARSREEYMEVFKRIASILKPGGILVFTEGLEDSWYVNLGASLCLLTGWKTLGVNLGVSL